MTDLRRAGFVFACGFASIAVCAAIAMASGTAFVFPSLGPTAFLHYYAPTLPPACPRNTMIGHAIGLVCGWGALWVCGLTDAGPALVVGVDGARVAAAALSLAATGAFMVLCRAPHPPAGATTLIVSLGILTRPEQLIIVEAAVALLTLQAILVHRLARSEYPWWGPK